MAIQRLRFQPAPVLSLLLLVALLLAGCVGPLTGGGTGGGNGTGTLAVYLTDAPALDIAEVWVTIREVQAHRDGAWELIHDFGNTPLSIDLLTLRFDEVLLGEALLPAGAYTQLRLLLDDSSPGASRVVHRDGSTSPLKVPSGEQTGLKVHHNFVVPENGSVELILDANILDFVHRAGASGFYVMNPSAIRVVDRVASGAITGRVLGEAEVGEPQPIADRQVTVTVKDAEGEVVAQTLALPDQGGAFRVNAVPAGVYTVLIEADNTDAAFAYAPRQFDGVEVTAGRETALNDGGPVLLARVAPVPAPAP